MWPSSALCDALPARPHFCSVGWRPGAALGLQVGSFAVLNAWSPGSGSGLALVLALAMWCRRLQWEQSVLVSRVASPSAVPAAPGSSQCFPQESTGSECLLALASCASFSLGIQKQ